MLSLSSAFAVGLGGFIGAILRAQLSIYFNNTIVLQGIVSGTLAVNIIGSFIMGVVYAFLNHTELISSNLKLFVTTGILGALTTFSTFAWESFDMLSQGRYLHFALNVSANVIATIIAVALAYLLVSQVLK